MATRSYYHITIQHPGLNKHRVIRGNDKYLVEAAAATQHRVWAEQYAKKVASDDRRRDREGQRQELEDNLREAEERTAEAQASLRSLRGVLVATLGVDDKVDWASMMQPPFPQPMPKEREFLQLPPEPVFDFESWKRRRSFVMRIISYLSEATATARAEFEEEHGKWKTRAEAVRVTNDGIYSENLRNFENWQHRMAAYEEERAKLHASVEQSRTAYQEASPDGILNYCDLVLSNSKYDECFPKEFEFELRDTAKTLLVQYQLPAPSDLPHIESVKFSKTKGTFVETEISKRDFESLYSDVVFQVALRTIHELFEADVVRALDVVIFNGNVRTLNPGTGHQEDRCVLTVRANQTAFNSINLRNIDSRACFDSLGGIAGAKMLDCKAVVPLGMIDKQGERFASAQDVSGEGSAGQNEWKELAKSISNPNEIRFLQLGTLAAILGFPVQEKFSAQLSRDLTEAIGARGLAIEPDARYGAPSYRSDDEIALFRPLETPVTTAYPGAAALLQLCVMIAAADEHPTEMELEIARDFIRNNTTLTSQEQQRLLVLEHYLCRNPETATRSLARLAKRLSSSQRQLVGEVLVCVAGADGFISSTEWKALERACKVLELSQNSLEEILQRLGANFDEPIIQEAEASTPGEPLPDIAAAAIAPSFTLDMARVAAISHETAEVIGLLSAVMSEEEPKSGPTPQSPPPPVESSDTPLWLDTLETKYRMIAARIVEKPSWQRAEFHQLSAEFKLMPLAVVDALNEWADEHLGDFLLEGDDPLSINASILPQKS